MIDYNYVVKYIVDVTCVSPIRSGTLENNPEDLLEIPENPSESLQDSQPEGTKEESDEKSAKKNCMIQAPSLVGAFADYIERKYGTKTRDMLFGSQNQEGILRITDLSFKDAKTETRPRLRIDGKTGTAADKAKFSVKHIATGSTGSFTLWQFSENEEKAKNYENYIVDALSALNGGVIRLGAQKTNGFGKVTLTVKREVYNLDDTDVLKAWLKNDHGTVCEETFSEFESRPETKTVLFTVSGRFDSVLVKSDVTIVDDKKGSLTDNIKENDVPVIPGSSLKGAVRARAEMIAPLLHLEDAVVVDAFGSAPDGEEKKAGTIYFSDIALASEKSSEKFKDTPRIRINMFTGGVISGALMRERNYCANICFTVEAPQDRKICLLLTYALRDLIAEFYPLGSGRSIGRGYLKNGELKIKSPDGRSATLKYNENEVEVTVSDNDKLLADWQKGDKS